MKKSISFPSQENSHHPTINFSSELFSDPRKVSLAEELRMVLRKYDLTLLEVDRSGSKVEIVARKMPVKFGDFAFLSG